MRFFTIIAAALCTVFVAAAPAPADTTSSSLAGIEGIEHLVARATLELEPRCEKPGSCADSIFQECHGKIQVLVDRLAVMKKAGKANAAEVIGTTKEAIAYLEALRIQVGKTPKPTDPKGCYDYWKLIFILICQLIGLVYDLFAYLTKADCNALNELLNTLICLLATVLAIVLKLLAPLLAGLLGLVGGLLGGLIGSLGCLLGGSLPVGCYTALVRSPVYNTAAANFRVLGGRFL